MPRDGRQLWARVDSADFELVDRFSPWYLWIDGTNWYPDAATRIGGVQRHILMHAVIMGEPPEPGLRVNHLNGDGLDNRRSNLAWATQSQILAKRKPPAGGSSRFKGVCWDRASGKWQAAFRRKKIGRFTDEIEAAKAFDAAARAYWGDAAYLNFPTDQ